MQPSPITELIISLARAVRDEGGRALLVGGCVRDRFYGVEPKDFDVEVFGIHAEKMGRLLEGVAANVIRVGRSFPVWKIWNEEMGTENAIDVALPRREPKADAVVLDPGMTFTEAASGRDFTMNAIGLDPLTEEIIDPHGGVADIHDRVLRHVSPRFSEDPLRVLRGMQFCGRFGLTAHPETIRFCQGLNSDGISSERLLEEWKKLILKAKVPSKGLQFLASTGWDRCFPELAALKGVPQEPEWHPEGDAWIHTGHCLDAFAKRRTGDEQKDLRVGLAVLCHDFGKATHTKITNGRVTAHGHEEAGEAPAEVFLRRMTDQTDLIQAIKVLVGRHMVPGSLHKEVLKQGKPEAMDASIRRLALQLSKQGSSLDDLALVCECDRAGRPPLPEHSPAIEWLRSRAQIGKVLHEKPKALLQGRDLIALGLAPGVEFKAIIDEAFQRQLDGGITNHENAVLFAQDWIRNPRNDG